MKNFIIHLSRILDSLETAKRLEKQLHDFDQHVELFEGTYGSDAISMMIDEDRIPHPWGIKGPPINFDIKNWDRNEGRKDLENWKPGIKGCFYSHYRLWKKCVELNEPIAIWEDDIILTREFIPVEWDDVLILALGHPKKSPNWIHYLENPEGKPAAVEYSHVSMPGCCGYAIKPHAAKKLLNEYANTFLPADNAINRYLVNIQIHNYIMGIAVIKEGKKSLTRTNIWKTFK
jgi:GR25 family glycosyltransferase involved in LPS biosynthesis